MEKASQKMSFEIVKRTLFPVVIFIAVIGIYIFYNLNILPLMPEALSGQLKKHILALLIISIAFLLQRIAGAVFAWYRDNIASKTITRLDNELVPLGRRTIKIIIWIVAILVILPLYGVSITALVTTLGVSSLAIALAAQDTIANIISGFLIMIDRPFRVGDKIKLPTGENVEVLDIGVRRSKFLAEDKAIIIVPNLDLSKSKIINYTYGKERQNR